MTVKKSPAARHRRWRGGRALLVIATLGALSFATASPASAATSSALRYSTDGGSTWSTSATVPAGGTVLVRQWYDNTGTATETAASLKTAIPSGFTRQSGSTKICLNPSTTNPSSPSASEQKCTNSAEGSVWSGSNLQISPSAGYYGESNGSTSGSTAFGRKRYLNIHQCTWWRNGSTDRTTFITDSAQNVAYDAGSNVANTADASENCGGGASPYSPLVGSTGVGAYDLLGNKYFNMHHCAWWRTDGTVDRFTAITNNGSAGGFGAGSDTSNTAVTSPNCGAAWSAPFDPLAGIESAKAYDFLDNRYFNVHQCVWVNTVDVDRFTTLTDAVTNPAYQAGTNVSNTVDASATCGAGVGAWNLSSIFTGVESFDLLDTARGHGYAQYALTAPANPTPAACAGAFNGTEAFSQSATYQSTQTATQTSSGNLTVDFSALSDPCPTNPIPAVDPVIGGAIVATAGAGYLLYRQQRARVA